MRRFKELWLGHEIAKKQFLARGVARLDAQSPARLRRRAMFRNGPTHRPAGPRSGEGVYDFLQPMANRRQGESAILSKLGALCSWHAAFGKTRLRTNARRVWGSSGAHRGARHARCFQNMSLGRYDSFSRPDGVNDFANRVGNKLWLFDVNMMARSDDGDVPRAELLRQPVVSFDKLWPTRCWSISVELVR